MPIRIRQSSIHDPGTLLGMTILALLAGLGTSACNKAVQRRDVRPLVMRDVPAQRLAYRFEADTSSPSEIKPDESTETIPEIRTEFKTNRKAEALLKTIKSPDGQRALVLYGPADEPTDAFRIDLFAADGRFLRKVT